jgi:hypothetical protein
VHHVDRVGVNAALDRAGVPRRLGATGDEASDTAALQAAFTHDALLEALLPAGAALLTPEQTGHTGPGHHTQPLAFVALRRTPCPDWVLVRPCECGDRTILVVGDTKRDAANNATAAIWGDRRARIPGTRWDATRLPVPPGLRTPHARGADGDCHSGCEWCKEQRGGLHIPSFRGQNDFYRAFDWAAPQQAGLTWPPPAVVDLILFMVLHEGPNIFARPGLTATAAEWRGTSYAEFLDRLLPLVGIEVVGMLARTLATARTSGSVYLLSGPGDRVPPVKRYRSARRALDQLWLARKRNHGDPYVELRHALIPGPVVTLDPAGFPVLGGDVTEAARHGWEQAITEAGWNLPGRPCACCGAADAAACGHVDRYGYRAPGEPFDPARAR